MRTVSRSVAAARIDCLAGILAEAAKHQFDLGGVLPALGFERSFMGEHEALLKYGFRFLDLCADDLSDVGLRRGRVAAVRPRLGSGERASRGLRPLPEILEHVEEGRRCHQLAS
jgi:hypothetical protein